MQQQNPATYRNRNGMVFAHGLGYDQDVFV